MARRRSRRHRSTFVFGAIWGVGLIGLNGTGVSALQMTVIVVAGVVACLLAAAHRRRLESARDRVVARPAAEDFPQPCVFVRWYGATREGASLRWG